MKLPPNDDRLGKRLLDSQRFAALATKSRDYPYLSLVAFAVTADLNSLVFCTPRKTSKFLNMTSNPQIALLIDNRTNRDSDLKNASALTVLGVAEECRGRTKKRLLDIFLSRHPKLRDFAASSDTALIRIRPKRFIFVTQFQEVKILEVS
jgi:nitroimidazol reductase NimA-like FMN-containing flavoprotein (pyridoxamine 5'-phosphate oxidase superfamily)